MSESGSVRVPSAALLVLVVPLALLFGGYLSARSLPAIAAALGALALARAEPLHGLAFVLFVAPFCGRAPGHFDPLAAAAVGTALGWMLQGASRGWLELARSRILTGGVLLAAVATVSLGPEVLTSLAAARADAQELFQTALKETVTSPLYALYSLYMLVTGLALAWLTATRAGADAPDAEASVPRRLVRVLLAGHAVTLLLGFADHAGLLSLRWYRPISSVIAGSPFPHRLVSTFWHPSWYAQWLAMMLPLSLGAAWHERGAMRPAAMALAAATAIGLPITYQRGGWFAALAGALVVGLAWLWRAGRAGLARRGPLIAAWLASVACGSWAVLAFTGQAADLARRAGEMGHISGREVLWKGAVALIRERPLLGHGHNTFGWIYPRRYPPDHPDFYGQNATAHNGYLQMAAGAGLLGLAAFGLLVASALASGVSTVRTAPARRAALAAGVSGALCAYLVHGLVQEFFHIQALAFVFWTLVGLIAALARPPLPAVPQPRRSAAPTQLPDWQEALG